MTTWEPKINGNEERGGARPPPKLRRRSARGLSPHAAGVPGASGDMGWKWAGGEGWSYSHPILDGVTGQVLCPVGGTGSVCPVGQGHKGALTGKWSLTHEPQSISEMRSDRETV